MIEYLAGSITHYPRLISDGIMHRATCSCSWVGEWRQHRGDSELEWGKHGLSTMQRNANKRSFSIIGNPLAKGSEN
jgi:hypothetical protein